MQLSIPFAIIREAVGQRNRMRSNTENNSRVAAARCGSSAPQWNRSRGLVEKYLERKHGSGVAADNAVVEGEYFPSSGDKSIDDLVMIDLLWIEGRFHVSPKHFYYSEIDSKTFRSLSHLELISDPNYKSGDTEASFRIRAAESLRGNVKIKVFDCRTGVLNELAIDLP